MVLLESSTLTTDTPPKAALSNARLESFARPLGAGAGVESETVLESADSYYYPSHFEPELPFPVLRTRFTSGLVTYVNPRTLRVERRYSTAGRRLSLAVPRPPQSGFSGALPPSLALASADRQRLTRREPTRGEWRVAQSTGSDRAVAPPLALPSRRPFELQPT